MKVETFTANTSIGLWDQEVYFKEVVPLKGLEEVLLQVEVNNKAGEVVLLYRFINIMGYMISCIDSNIFCIATKSSSDKYRKK
jgi:choline-glycine betaine transporter